MQLTNIDIIRHNFKIKNNYPLISNISYTYQYIEYLSNNILFEHNTSVITKLLIKDYIINSISIIEAIFYSLLNPIYNFKHPVSFNYLFKNIIKENILKLTSEDIKLLYNLKTLRNKIHIYSSFQAKLTDYNSYTLDDYYLMRTILYKILNNSLVSNGKFKIKEKNARK